MFWILLHVSLLVPVVQMLVLNGSTEAWTRPDLSLPTANTTRLTDQNPLNGTTTIAPQTGNLTLNVTSDPRASRKQAPRVKEPFPTWARVLLVPLVVLVLVTGAVFCPFRHNCMRGYNSNIEADSGQLFVQLPCRTNGRLPSDAKVEWTDCHGNKVHVYQNHHSVPEKQIQFYRTRTEMSVDPLQTGDLSLRLRFPTGADTDTYTCCVYSRRKRILMKRQVQLQVKVQQVEVCAGADKVLLPCHTSAELFKSCKVEWKDSDNQMVHVFQDGSDRPENQDRFYRNRTETNKDWTQTGDLTLTLKRLTYEDSNIYTCSIFNEEGTILYKKQVQLKVQDCQVEVEEGAESVLLPFKVAPELLKSARVVWWRYDPEPVVIVHAYRYLSDQLQEQDHHYRTRTKMNEDLLQTGDISLTLSRPAADAESYRCGVWRGTKLVAWTTVLLKFKGGVRVQDEDPGIRDRSDSIDMTPLMSAESNDSLFDALT